MLKFTVVWHYIANYGVVQLEAPSAERAIESVRLGFSEDFRLKANLFAFVGEPVAVHTSDKYPEKIARWS